MIPSIAEYKTQSNFLFWFIIHASAYIRGSEQIQVYLYIFILSSLRVCIRFVNTYVIPRYIDGDKPHYTGQSSSSVRKMSRTCNFKIE